MRLLVALVALGALLPRLATANSAPVVSNVVAQQIPSTGQVRVTYDVEDADGDQVTAILLCSSNGGASFDLLPVSVSGHVNSPMSPGTGKVIVWNAALDYPGRYWSQVVAKVVASDGPATAGEMVLVPAGPFTMGVDGSARSAPAHAVTLDAYYIDTYEVTNAEYQRFMEAGGYTTQAYWSAAGWSWRVLNSVTQPRSWNNSNYHSGPSYPGFAVTGVSYYEAEAYAQFAGKRLPTEAEWEKAARGTGSALYPWGGNALDPSYASYFNSGGPYGNGTYPVGFFDGRTNPLPLFHTADAKGPYGTYDQAGNALEWVHDWFGDYGANPSVNPQGPGGGNHRVTRGGSCISGSGPGCEPADQQLLSTWRAAYDCDGFYMFSSDATTDGNPNLVPGQRLMNLGFRCARSIP